jgi:hypothetical protein
LQRAVDQHIELGIVIAFPPSGRWPAAVGQVNHLRELSLLRVDDGDLARIVLN